MPNRRNALVVLSGGQDSTTCLGWALQQFERVFCVTFEYGQRHNIEINAAMKVVEFFASKVATPINHEIIPIGEHVLRGSSPLVNPHEQLEMYANHEEMEQVIGDRVEKTFVPLRNAVFLTIAANRAVSNDCGYIVTGVCQADNANYPDCRLSFIKRAEETINHALGIEDATDRILISTPLMFYSKADSVRMATGLPYTYDALAYSHTAYDGKYPPTSKDHASVLRAHGFEQSGMPDPLVLRAFREGLMDLPSSPNYDQFRQEETARMLGGK